MAVGDGLGLHLDFLESESAEVIEFSVFPRGDVTLVAVGGEIDLCTAPTLRAELASVFAGRDTVVVLDLSAVTFFAAAGLRILEQAQAEIEVSHHHRMVLVTQARCVDRVIEMVGLATNLRRFQSLGAALAVLEDSVVGCGEPA